MAKVQMEIKDLLKLIRQGILNGNLSSTVALIDDALPQIPDPPPVSHPLIEPDPNLPDPEKVEIKE